MAKIVAVTGCPTGITHTMMAAEALKKTAQSMGHQLRVETQGAEGVRDALTIEEIEAADVVIVSSDIHVDMSRFVGKPIYETSTKAAIHNGAEMVEQAFAEATVLGAEGKRADLAGDVQQIKKSRAAARTGPYKHLMTGVSYMLPFVVAGGLLIALAFAFGGIYVYDNENTFGWALFQIGAPSAFALMVPILAGFIAYSIADRPGIAPGMVGAMPGRQRRRRVPGWNYRRLHCRLCHRFSQQIYQITEFYGRSKTCAHPAAAGLCGNRPADDLRSRRPGKIS